MKGKIRVHRGLLNHTYWLFYTDNDDRIINYKADSYLELMKYSRDNNIQYKWDDVECFNPENTMSYRYLEDWLNNKRYTKDKHSDSKIKLIKSVVNFLEDVYNLDIVMFDPVIQINNKVVIYGLNKHGKNINLYLLGENDNNTKITDVSNLIISIDDSGIKVLKYRFNNPIELLNEWFKYGTTNATEKSET